MSTTYFTWKDRSCRYRSKVYSEVTDAKARAMVEGFFFFWDDVTNQRTWNAKRAELIASLNPGYQLQNITSPQTNSGVATPVSIAAITGAEAVVDFYTAAFNTLLAAYPDFTVLTEISSITVTNWVAEVNGKLTYTSPTKGTILTAWTQAFLQLDPINCKATFLSSIETGFSEFPF